MTILVTGFEPFNKLSVNPSQLLVEHLAECAASYGLRDIRTEVLKTEYAASGAQVRELIHTLKPRAFVGLGVAGKTPMLRLERVALNLDDASIPDNAGVLLDGEPIMPGAPLAYLSSLPLKAMRDALQAQDIPVEISNHAGAYICNHVFYTARHEFIRVGLTGPCGFIHIPLMAEQADAGPDRPGLPFKMLVTGIVSCLRLVSGV